MKRLTFFALLLLVATTFIRAQGNDERQLIEILMAEDELRYDEALEKLMTSSNAAVRKRATLAAGRIGDEDAIPALEKRLADDAGDVRQMAAFAIGEVESIKGADSILAVLGNKRKDGPVRARAVEAAGKIVAANPEHGKAEALKAAILDNLEYEANRRSRPNEQVILLGLTAALRAKPEGAENTLKKFLRYGSWKVRADALNALARLAAKNANARALELLTEDENPIVRANAARVLGGAGDKTVVPLLVKRAVGDKDLRVRINAIRALNRLKDSKSADALLDRARYLLERYRRAGDSNSPEINELLTIGSALGSILKGTKSAPSLDLINEARKLDRYQSPEFYIALAQLDPEEFIKTGFLAESFVPEKRLYFKIFRSGVRGLGSLSKEDIERGGAIEDMRKYLEPPRDFEMPIEVFNMILPVVLREYSKFERPGLEEALFDSLRHKDVFVRSAAASILGQRETNRKVIDALAISLKAALKHDKRYDDAQLAILSALVKLDKNAAKESLELALNHYAILIRRRAANLIKENGLEKDFPKLNERVGTVRKYDPKNGSKLGQVLNSKKDYQRALSRRNGKSQAVLKTEKGSFTIEFFPEQAPLTVDNFIKLARSGYFNGIDIHRVVPNFVVQDGDPRGDGNGGPGWQIRCEINQIPYERGMVGMALSGKDTGGSQWFVTHSRQPHLEGGYTIFGKVLEKDMKVVDRLVRGDKILSVSIEDAPGADTN